LLLHITNIHHETGLNPLEFGRVNNLNNELCISVNIYRLVTLYNKSIILVNKNNDIIEYCFSELLTSKNGNVLILLCNLNQSTQLQCTMLWDENAHNEFFSCLVSGLEERQL